MKEFTEAQKQTLRDTMIRVNQANREYKLFADYLIKEYQVDENWELTLDGFRERTKEEEK